MKGERAKNNALYNNMKSEKFIKICEKYERGNKSLITACELVANVYNEEHSGNLINAIDDVELLIGRPASTFVKSQLLNKMKFVQFMEV